MKIKIRARYYCGVLFVTVTKLSKDVADSEADVLNTIDHFMQSYADKGNELFDEVNIILRERSKNVYLHC